MLNKVFTPQEILPLLPVRTDEIALYITNLYEKGDGCYVTVDRDKFYEVFGYDDPEELEGERWKIMDCGLISMESERSFIRDICG